MQQYEINEIFEAFIKVLEGASEYEINMFTPLISKEEALKIKDLIPKAKEYLAANPAKKPLIIPKRR